MRVIVDTNTLLSGLFFPGNERDLLLLALQGKAHLILPEDGSDELFRVIEEAFLDSEVLAEALRLLERLFRVVEPVGRETYRGLVSHWEAKLRDPSDAFLFACAKAVDADGIVTGDRDILEVKDGEGIRLFRTRGLLDDLRRTSGRPRV